MLVLLVALIAIMLGFKFYPRITKVVSLVGIFGFFLIIIIAVIYAAFNPVKNHSIVSQQVSLPTPATPFKVVQPSSVLSDPIHLTPTPYLVDCVVNGNVYKMTMQQCNDAMANDIAQTERKINNNANQMNNPPTYNPSIWSK